MNYNENLINAIDEIANLHDLGKKNSETLKEVALHTIAIENVLLQKGVISKEELSKEILKQKRP